MLSESIEFAKLALQLWNSKEARKYLDELLAIEKNYLEEINKGRPIRGLDGKIRGYSSARIDELSQQLRHLRSRITTAAGITGVSANLQ